MAKRQRFTEHVAIGSITEDRIDREQGIVRDVLLLGKDSNREYSRKAMQEAAELYPGTGINLAPHRTDGSDHHAVDGFGEVQGRCHVREDGVYGNIGYNTKHEKAEWFLEQITRFSRQIAMSHDAEGELSSRRGQKPLVESVDVVNSLEIVRKGGHRRGFFESEGDTMILREFLNKSETSDEQKRLLKLLEMDEFEDMGEIAVEEPPEDGVKAGAKTMALAVMDQFFDGALDANGALSKLRVIMNAEAKVADNGETNDESESEDDMADPAVTEQLKQLVTTNNQLLERMERQERRAMEDDALKAHGFERSQLTEEQAKGLTDAADEGELAKLIEGWEPPRRRPKSVLARFREDDGGAGTYAEERKKVFKSA